MSDKVVTGSGTKNFPWAAASTRSTSSGFGVKSGVLGKDALGMGASEAAEIMLIKKLLLVEEI
jgi:hypothetical protein